MSVCWKATSNLNIFEMHMIFTCLSYQVESKLQANYRELVQQFLRMCIFSQLSKEWCGWLLTLVMSVAWRKTSTEFLSILCTKQFEWQIKHSFQVTCTIVESFTWLWSKPYSFFKRTVIWLLDSDNRLSSVIRWIFQKSNTVNHGNMLYVSWNVVYHGLYHYSSYGISHWIASASPFQFP